MRWKYVFYHSKLFRTLHNAHKEDSWNSLTIVDVSSLFHHKIQQLQGLKFNIRSVHSYYTLEKYCMKTWKYLLYNWTICMLDSGTCSEYWEEDSCNTWESNKANFRFEASIRIKIISRSAILMTFQLALDRSPGFDPWQVKVD